MHQGRLDNVLEVVGVTTSIIVTRLFRSLVDFGFRLPALFLVVQCISGYPTIICLQSWGLDYC